MNSVLRLIPLAALAVTSWASVIVNGDFETLGDYPGLHNGVNLSNLSTSMWDVYASIPGWTTFTGAGIEVEANTVVTAHSGIRYVELDSDITSLSNQKDSGMVQTVLLSPGHYDLIFWYRPRTDTPGDNEILASVGGQGSILVNSTSSQMPDWTKIVMPFWVQAGGAYDVKFQALDSNPLSNDGLGGFVDDVSIVPNPEPVTFVLLGTGLMALALIRRRKPGRANQD